MRKWWPLVAICLGAFILLVDVTIVNVALPSMADGLHASFSSLQWVIDAYTLALAALVLVTGSLADAFGHRRLYVAGLTVFGLASLGCALAPNSAVLVASRTVQGIGGAAMFATSAALISTHYHGRDRGTAFGVWGAVNGAAAAAGPVLGGLLTQHLGWQAIFLVNLPIAAVAIALTLAVMAGRNRTDGPHRTTRVDVPGAVAFTVSAAALTFALIRGGEAEWGSATTLGSFALAALALLVFVAAERRSAAPMLDLALLRRPSFATLMGAAVLMQGAAFGALVLVSIWLQSALDLDPVAAGLALLPMAATSFVVSAVAGRFTQRTAPRLPIGVGLLFIAAGAGLLAYQVGTGSGQSALVAGLCVSGVGVGLATPVLVSAAAASVPPHRIGMAGGAVNTFRQLGLTLAIAVFGALFAARARGTFAGSAAFGGGNGHAPDPQAAASALSGGQARRLVEAAPPAHRAAADHLVREAFAAGLDQVFLWSAVGAAVAGVLVLLLVRTRGAGHGSGPVKPAAGGADGGPRDGERPAGEPDGAASPVGAR